MSATPASNDVYGTCYGCGSKDVGKYDAYCAKCVADDPTPAEQLATFDAYHAWADSHLKRTAAIDILARRGDPLQDLPR